MTEKVKIGVDPNGPGTTLRVVANTLLRFRSDRRWIDVKHFVFPGDPTDLELLALLVGHRQFRDDYIGSGPRDSGVHGPYRLEAVTPDRYERVDAVEATR